MTPDPGVLEAIIRIRSTLHHLAEETVEGVEVMTGMLTELNRADLVGTLSMTLLLLRKMLERDALSLEIPETALIDTTLDEFREICGAAGQ